MSETASPTSETTNRNSSTVDQSEVIAFHELTAQQQSAFRDALQSKASFVPNTSYVDDSKGYDLEQVTPFRDHDYVRYERDLYWVQLESGNLYASYAIRTSVDSPTSDDTVTAFNSLPEDIQDEVKTAITEGVSYAPSGKWDSLPVPLGGTDYIRYENQTYKMEYTVGDQWAEVLTVKKAE